jgi:hypothetical protein
VLTAIIVPTVLYPDDKTLDISWHNPSLLAAVLAAVVGFESHAATSEQSIRIAPSRTKASRIQFSSS